jgi:hypothetical protein
MKMIIRNQFSWSGRLAKDSYRLGLFTDAKRLLAVKA